MEDLSKDEFYEACEVELEALLVLEKHYVERAKELAQKETNPQRKKELEEIAANLEQVPAKPAKTFKQALQSIHFYHFTLWDGFHIGRVDQFLLPYYLSDIHNGTLTREEALDRFLALVKSFISLGGFQLQFNVVSADKLHAARENPEEYRDLMVRVGGFSTNFVKLTPEMQQELIDRTEHIH